MNGVSFAVVLITVDEDVGEMLVAGVSVWPAGDDRLGVFLADVTILSDDRVYGVRRAFSLFLGVEGGIVLGREEVVLADLGKLVNNRKRPEKQRKNTGKRAITHNE